MLIAVYAVARLLQVPIEATSSPKRWIALLLISAPAILIIAVLALDLVTSAGRASESLPNFR